MPQPGCMLLQIRIHVSLVGCLIAYLNRTVRCPRLCHPLMKRKTRKTASGYNLRYMVHEHPSAPGGVRLWLHLHRNYIPNHGPSYALAVAQLAIGKVFQLLTVGVLGVQFQLFAGEL